MKLLIGTPANRDPKHHFQTSLLELAIHLGNSGIQTAINLEPQISNLVYGRQSILNKAINEGYSHLLFIDNDMLFQPKAFEFLKSRDKDFVAANCVPKPHIEQIVKNKNYILMPTSKDFDGQCISSIGKSGTQKCSSTGLAYALLKIEAIKKIPAPHFAMNEFGEDVNFCSKLRENGIDIHIDHDASRHVWHIGDFPHQENFQ